MSHRITSLLGAALMLTPLSVLSVGPVFGESVMVKRGYVHGRVSYVENLTEIEQEISGLPMPPMKFHMEQLFGLREKTESAPDGGTRTVLIYDRAARKVEAPMMGEVEFDTDDPENEEAAPQLGTILKPMIDMAITMEQDKDGNVVSFSGLDAINKKISEIAIASMHWEHMKEEFTNKQGKETWGTMSLLIYPNKEVKVGDEWKASSSMERPMVGTIVTDYQYKVDRIGVENGRKIVSISFTGAISKGAEDKIDTESNNDGSKVEGENTDTEKEEAENAEPEAEVKGEVSGTASYDVELGRIVKQTSQSDVDIRIPLSKIMPNVPSEGDPQFASIKTAIKSTTSILTEKERNAQKAEAKRKAEARRKAEEEEDDEEEDD